MSLQRAAQQAWLRAHTVQLAEQELHTVHMCMSAPTPAERQIGPSEKRKEVGLLYFEMGTCGRENHSAVLFLLEMNDT